MGQSGLDERRALRRVNAASGDLVASPFRADRDRIASSPFFARLAGVTQVVSPSGAGLLVHNRLTHSLKVAQVARAIADRITAEHPGPVAELGGCDADVVEAAALGHDLGHPPFGHLGEQVLDRIARFRFGLPDGFEGNAQSFRIITTTDVRGPDAAGLDLTAAVRAALLKYPWCRRLYPDPHPSTLPAPPRGAGEPEDGPGSGSVKFSAYLSDLEDLRQARAGFAGLIDPFQQTVEAAVMDTADDVAYSIHDLEDFHRAGVLRHTSVAEELDTWLREAGGLARAEDAEIHASGRRPGHSLERLRRRLRAKDAWIMDDEAFTAAVRLIRAELVDGLLAVSFDGSVEAEQRLISFTTRWTARLIDGVRLTARPHPRGAYVELAVPQWHEVAVLKFVHQRFVLLRPDLALHQRGQARLLTTLVDVIDQWLLDRHEADRLPRRLHDLVTLAEDEIRLVAAEFPTALTPIAGGRPREEELSALARGRATIDFVASLTDAQAGALLAALSGQSTQLWTDSFVL